MDTAPRPSPKAATLAVLVPLLGAFLLLPPAVLLFASDLRVLGLPVIVLYLFAVWAALIAATFVVGRRLPEPPAPDEPAQDLDATRSPR